MAKIAGRKNDGAWFRMNTFLINSPTQVNQNFAQNIESLDTLDNAFNVITVYANNTGAILPDTLKTKSAWITALSIGIPRQVWDGVTTYDAYIHSPGSHVYTKLMGSAIFRLAVDLRYIAKQIRFGDLELQLLSQLDSQVIPAAKEKLPEGRSAIREYKRPLVAAFLERPETREWIEARKKHLTLIADKSKSMGPGGGTSEPTLRKSARRA